jgi:glucose-6-phosphate 1-dehydrogenase
MKTNDDLQPTVFVIFGGAGDLTWRKLVPALFDLSQDRSMPAAFSVIAVDPADLSDIKLRRRLHDGVKKFSRQGLVKTGEWAKFAGHIRYQQGDF